MKLTIAVVGKVKEKFYRQAIEEYEKRLSRYCSLRIVEVADEKTPDHASIKEENRIRQTEGERLLKVIPEDSYVIALAIKGKMRDSVDLAGHLEQLQVKGYSHLTFIIGGSLGLSSQVLQSADEQLSFSPMTFPHQLMRVILLEQIYRCFRISRGEPYHK